MTFYTNVNVINFNRKWIIKKSLNVRYNAIQANIKLTLITQQINAL